MQVKFISKKKHLIDLIALINICMLRVDEIRFRNLVLIKKKCSSGFDRNVFKHN